MTNFVYRLRSDGLLVLALRVPLLIRFQQEVPIMHPDLDAISIIPMFPPHVDRATHRHFLERKNRRGNRCE